MKTFREYINEKVSQEDMIGNINESGVTQIEKIDGKPQAVSFGKKKVYYDNDKKEWIATKKEIAEIEKFLNDSNKEK